MLRTSTAGVHRKMRVVGMLPGFKPYFVSSYSLMRHKIRSFCKSSHSRLVWLGANLTSTIIGRAIFGVVLLYTIGATDPPKKNDA